MSMIFRTVVLLLALLSVVSAADDFFHHQPPLEPWSMPQSATAALQESTAPDQNRPCSWTLYKQCDSRWGSHRLGTSSNTICSAGCAMSSVAMALASHGIRISGSTATPDSLNTWLTHNGGYVSGDLIVWNAVSKLGMSTLSIVSGITKDKLKEYVRGCHPIVANVNNGGHWVLVTGWQDSNDNVWYVNDPGYSRDTYTFSAMIRFIIYKY